MSTKTARELPSFPRMGRGDKVPARAIITGKDGGDRTKSMFLLEITRDMTFLALRNDNWEDINIDTYDMYLIDINMRVFVESYGTHPSWRGLQGWIQHRIDKGKFDHLDGMRSASRKLRSATIKLAFENPELRQHLLPLLSKTASNWSKLFPRNSYLNKFFKEKRIPYKVFEKKDKHGVVHMIENGVVVEMIAQTSGRERQQIEDTIRKIDFHNGDLNHFFDHLAGAIADRYGSPF